MVKNSRGCAASAGGGREEKLICGSAKTIRNIRTGDKLPCFCEQ